MKVLVTGATGFIGTHLISELIKDPTIEVIATSRDKNKAQESQWYKEVCYIPFDIHYENLDRNLYEFFNKPDLLIHLAWDGLLNYDDLSHMEHIYFSNQGFVKNLLQNGLKNISVTGTCLEYGMVSGKLDEDMVPMPSNAYAIGKDMLRRYIELLNETIDFNFKWIRLFYIYGDGQSKKSLYSSLIEAIKNDEKEFNMSKGDQIRDFMSIKSVVSNIIQISKQNNVLGAINCCSNEPISVRKFVESYLKKHDYNLKLNLGYYPYPTYESMAFWGDDSRLKKIKDEI